MVRNANTTQTSSSIARFRGFMMAKDRKNKQRPTPDSSQTIEIEKGKLRVRIPVQNIIFVKSEHVYSRIFFYNDQRILQRISLDKLLEQLPADKFIRVHRSYLVNVDYVQKFNSTNILVGETVIPIGRTWRDKVLAVLHRLKD